MNTAFYLILSGFRKLIIALAVLSISAATTFFPEQTYAHWKLGKFGAEIYYHYRITVEIDTPEGVRSGSSVISVYRERCIGFPDFHHGTGGDECRNVAKGEAAYIDLGGNKHLIALLPFRGMSNRPALFHFAETVYMHKPGEPYHYYRVPYQRVRDTAARIGERKSLPEGFRPVLVNFTDPADPAGIELAYKVNVIHSRTTGEIESITTDDRIADIFGDGYAFKDAFIEIIERPPFDPLLKQHFPYIKNDEDYFEHTVIRLGKYFPWIASMPAAVVNRDTFYYYDSACYAGPWLRDFTERLYGSGYGIPCPTFLFMAPAGVMVYDLF